MSLAHLRLALCLCTAPVQTAWYLGFICTHSTPDFLQLRPPALPRPMGGAYVSPALQVRKVNVGNEEDGLRVQVHEGLEDGDVRALVRGKHGHFDIGNWGETKEGDGGEGK